MYRKQEEAIFCQERIGCIEASTKAGKTVGCLSWIIEQAVMGKTGQNYWWVAPSYKQTSIAFRRCKQGLPSTLYVSNESDHKVTMANGTVIWFLSGEIPDNLYGEDVFACVCDEASRLREEAWHAVRSTLTATRGPVRLIGNVRGKKNWFYRLARRAEAGEKNMHFAKIRAQDAVEAGVLEQDEIDSAKAVLPEMVYKELYEAEPGDDVGNPFGIAAIRRCVRGIKHAKPVAYGVDLAKSIDWTWILGMDDDGDTCHSERFQKPWKETRERIHKVVGPGQALIDSTGVGDPIVEDMQREWGSNYEGYKFTPISRQQLMEGLAVAIQSGIITFPEDVANQLEEFEYVFNKTGGVKYAAPEGFHDDGAMALALCVQKLAHLSGAVGLLKFYEKLMLAQNKDKEIPAPSPRPAPVAATPEHEEVPAVQLYKATMARLQVKEFCKFCGEPLDGNSTTDGYSSWHPRCWKPEWARVPVAAVAQEATFSIAGSELA